MDSASSGTEPFVVIAGADPDDLEGVRQAVAAFGGRVQAAGVPRTPDDGQGPWGDAGADPAVVVAVGDDALAATARADRSAPVLPVDCGRPFESTPLDVLPPALETVLEGGAGERTVAVLEVAVRRGSDTVATESDAGTEATDATRALFDVALVTAGPATISEFGIRDRDAEETRVRADGVVVATPAGSDGYAHAAGGPALAKGTDAVSVVPIAPFDTDRPRWVLPPTDVCVSVERDEPISLQVDGRQHARIGADATVSMSAGEEIRLLSTDVTD